MKYPLHLIKLIEHFKRLPGVGNKTAERFAFQLLSWQASHRNELATLIDTMHAHLTACERCGSLSDEKSCSLCDDPERDSKMLCVVASQKEVFAFEATGQYRGLYHVLGSYLSPLDGRKVDTSSLDKLQARIHRLKIEEVIIALDATLEGDATAFFVKENLQNIPIKISRIACGLPQNCQLEFVDGSTLSCALRARSLFT